MDAMGIDQTFIYPTWFAEGFHLVEDPDVSYALARAYNDWIADFCQVAPDRLFAAAMVPLGNMDFAIAELRRVAGIRCFRGAFIRPMFIEGHYFTHPYYDPLWAELESLGMTAAVHPSAGLWNPEWTSHGPFIEKVKDRLTQAAALGGGGGGAFAGGSTDDRNRVSPATGLVPLGHPLAPILSPLAGQPPVRRVHADRLYRDAAVPAYAGGNGPWESLLDGGGPGKNGGLHSRYPASALLSPSGPTRKRCGRKGRVMLGFDAEERLIQELPYSYENKIVWGSRYPHHDTTSAWEAIQTLTQADVDRPVIARMVGENAREQFGLS